MTLILSRLTANYVVQVADCRLVFVRPDGASRRRLSTALGDTLLANLEGGSVRLKV